MYPALLMAGPPHRGKSVLAHALSRALEGQRRACYLFKATPDGEGHWFQEADEAEATRQRDKRPWDAAFLRRASEIIARRPLPYLVDAGGQPTAEQSAAILAHCTDAIILGQDAQELRFWRELVGSLGLTIVAEVTSRLDGAPALLDEGTPLRLRLPGLRRHSAGALANEAGAALVARVGTRFPLTIEEAWVRHRAQLPPGYLPLNLERWIWERTGSSRWAAEHLVPLLEELPSSGSIALYGAKANWLVGALARALKAPLTLFDAQYGWLAVPTLEDGEEGPWQATWGEGRLKIRLADTLLRPAATLRGPLPRPVGEELVLEGRLPHWLLAALVHHYAPLVPRMALYNPSQGVVHLPDSGGEGERARPA